MNEAERRFLALMESQYGAGSRAQALECGMTTAMIDRRIAAGRYELLFPGVYRAAGSTRVDRQRALAATLWLGEDALVSHETAAMLLQLERLRTRQLHVSVPRTIRRRQRSNSIRLHRSLTLDRRDRTIVDGIPCTSATRTLLDCASRTDEESLEIAFEHARRMGLTSPRALAQRAADISGSGRAGSSAIRRLLSHQLTGARALESTLEVKAERLIRTSTLPVPARQHSVGRYRLDFAWVPLRRALECEGFEAHGNRLQWKRDRRRTARLERLGWRLMFVTWEDVTRHPAETLDRIALLLGGDECA
jgi:very-short-patch-repair endonuclease